MATKSPKAPEEKPDRFLRIMQFQTWFFLIALLIDVIYILIKGIVSGNGLFSGPGEYSLIIALITMLGSGFGFGLTYMIKANPSRKKNLFNTYLLSMVLVAVIAVFVLSAYQW